MKLGQLHPLFPAQLWQPGARGRPVLRQAAAAKSPIAMSSPTIVLMVIPPSGSGGDLLDTQQLETNDQWWYAQPLPLGRSHATSRDRELLNASPGRSAEATVRISQRRCEIGTTRRRTS
jgi:hypothetical protein